MQPGELPGGLVEKSFESSRLAKFPGLDRPHRRRTGARQGPHWRPTPKSAPAPVGGRAHRARGWHRARGRTRSSRWACWRRIRAGLKQHAGIAERTAMPASPHRETAGSRRASCRHEEGCCLEVDQGRLRIAVGRDARDNRVERGARTGSRALQRARRMCDLLLPR